MGSASDHWTFDDGRCCRDQSEATLLRFLITGSESDGRMTVVETLEQKGASLPLHIHHHEDEFIYVLEGQVNVHRDGVRATYSAGDWLFLPRGLEHTYVVESDQARLLIMLTPAGMEDFFRELWSPTKAEHDYQEAERLVIVAARFGLDITAPAPAPDEVETSSTGLVSETM